MQRLELVVIISNNNGLNGILFYDCGDDHIWRGLLPIIMLPNGDFLLRCTCMLFWFWILTTWGSVQIEETVVGWHNPLRMKTSALHTVLHTCNYVPFTFTSHIWWLAAVNCNCTTVYHHLIRQDLTSESMTHDHHQRKIKPRSDESIGPSRTRYVRKVNWNWNPLVESSGLQLIVSNKSLINRDLKVSNTSPTLLNCL